MRLSEQFQPDRIRSYSLLAIALCSAILSVAIAFLLNDFWLTYFGGLVHGYFLDGIKYGLLPGWLQNLAAGNSRQAAIEQLQDAWELAELENDGLKAELQEAKSLQEKAETELYRVALILSEITEKPIGKGVCKWCGADTPGIAANPYNKRLHHDRCQLAIVRQLIPNNWATIDLK